MRLPSRARGFTLLEIALLVGIGIVVLTIVLEFALNLFKTNRIVTDTLTSIEDGRQTVAKFVTELRTAAVSEVGAYPITEAGASAITFYSDIDNDGLKEQIRYAVDGTNLVRSEIKPTGSPPTYDPADETTATVAASLLNPSSVFAYYDANYNGTTPPLSQPVDIPSIRLVKISLTIDRLATEAPEPYYISSQVNLRNLKDNL